MIPKVISKMGQYWEQPKPEDILIDDTHALMSELDYHKLAVYETTLPTGSYVGKMFRRFNNLVWIIEDTTGKSPSGMVYTCREILLIRANP